MIKENMQKDRDKENKKVNEKNKIDEWHKKEKIKIIEQRKEYTDYIKGVMHKKGMNPKLKKDKYLGGVRGRG